MLSRQKKFGWYRKQIWGEERLTRVTTQHWRSSSFPARENLAFLYYLRNFFLILLSVQSLKWLQFRSTSIVKVYHLKKYFYSKPPRVPLSTLSSWMLIRPSFRRFGKSYERNGPTVSMVVFWVWDKLRHRYWDFNFLDIKQQFYNINY